MAVACSIPFENLEIGENGDVYTCCPDYINCKKIGNIFSDNSFEDIWYSKSATEIRQAVLDGSYSCCNLDVCRAKRIVRNDKFTLRPPLPKYFTFSYDKECNICCITCRDERIRNTEEQKELFDKKAEQILIPLMKNAKSLRISGSGEFLASEHTRKLIKTLTEKCPKLLFRLQTNGLLFNKKNVEILGLENKIDDVYFSIHSLKEETYNKIMRHSNLSVVLENLKWAADLQQKREVDSVKINTVISDYNYTEIPDLIKLGQSLNVFVSFSMYYKWGALLDNEYDNLAVWHENHPHFNDFVRVLKSAKSIKYRKYSFPPLFQQILKSSKG